MTDNEKIKDIIKELMKQKKRIGELLLGDLNKVLATAEDTVHEACFCLTEAMGMEFLEGEKFLDGLE
jgi:hypothetical protein